MKARILALRHALLLCLGLSSIGYGADNAQFISQSVPTQMVAGRVYAVSVTMKNNGTTTWTAATNFNLGSQNPQDTMRWGLNRVPTPGSVAPNANVTFNFNVTAPTAAGAYNFQWKMVHDYVAWFGALTTNVAIYVAPNSAPTVTLTSPTQSANFNPPGSITFTATASDSDGTIQKVEFFHGGTNLIASVTSPPYTYNWTNVASGAYSLTAKATDDVNLVSTSSPVNITVSTPPAVSMTSPTNNSSFNTPANVTLTATASDSDGTIQKVEFFQGGTTLIATVTTPPYTYEWANVPIAAYTLTAKATDNLGVASTSAPVNINVVGPHAALYFIHPDHLGTPRQIYNDQQQLAWRWDQQEPFGNSPPNENPTGLGTFECNLRFPGQYFDKETNLAYNYFRDFDPGLGRYAQSDPLGIAFDVSLYAYVKSSPLIFSDSLGLAPGDKTFGLPREFWNWYHRQMKQPGDPDLTKEQAKELFEEWKNQGKPGPDARGKRRGPKGGGRLFMPLCIFDIVQEYCAANPGDLSCLFATPRNPNDVCKGTPDCI